MDCKAGDLTAITTVLIRARYSSNHPHNHMRTNCLQYTSIAVVRSNTAKWRNLWLLLHR